MKLSPYNMSHGTHHGRHASSPRSDGQMYKEQMRRETKANFEKWLQIARDNDMMQELASKKLRAEQDKGADRVRERQKYIREQEKFPGITARSATAERNDRERDLRDLTRRSNQYECRWNSIGYYDEHDQYCDEHDQRHTHSKFHNPAEPISNSTVYPKGIDKRLMQQLHQMELREERRKYR